MSALLLVLLLVIILGGVGFAAHAVWVAAGVVLLLWLIGFVVRSGESARWYRW